MRLTDEPVYIRTEEALEALRGAAWEQPAPNEDAACGHPGCTDHPGQGTLRIHTMLGPIGADWDLTDAEEFARRAQRCAWVPHLLGHELGVLGANGKAVYFDVRRPVVAADHGVSAQGTGSPHEPGEV